MVQGWKFYSCACVLTADLVERDGGGLRNNRGNVSTYSMC